MELAPGAVVFQSEAVMAAVFFQTDATISIVHSPLNQWPGAIKSINFTRTVECSSRRYDTVQEQCEEPIFDEEAACVRETLILAKRVREFRKKASSSSKHSRSHMLFVGDSAVCPESPGDFRTFST